jgi:hypothetical protein
MEQTQQTQQTQAQQGVHIDPKAFNIKNYLAQLNKQTLSDIAKGTFNALVMGELGAGKSHLFITCPAPIMIDAFDPGTARLAVYKPLIQSGKLIINDYSAPGMYSQWEKDFEMRVKNNVLNSIGTYGLDSFTTWFRSQRDELARSKGRADGIPYQSDYLVLGLNIINIVTICTAANCNFILTAHMDLDKEEVTGRMIARFRSIPSLKTDIPTLFDEVYVLQSEETREGAKRSLVTQSTGKYTARTRIGSGIFDVHEEPDIKKLLAKAGMPSEDKEVI